jgi:AhpC/TSA family
MSKIRIAAACTAFSIAVLCAPQSARASAEVGKPAPDFSVAASDGKSYSLSEYRGKYVVLEWLNHGCPYVRKHYDTGNMQSLQKEMAAEGVVWFSIISSAPGHEGHSDADKANADAKANDAHPAAILLDGKGDVGRSYEAKTTPHMFVIGPDGTLLYKGAIDDKPTFAKDTVAGAKNYVRQAISEAMAGKPVSEAITTPYGCSVKY